MLRSARLALFAVLATCAPYLGHAASVPARCETIQAVLASARGGETIALTGDCPKIKITQSFPTKVTIDATRAKVAGLELLGGNVGWRGGIITAAKGMNGIARDGYAAYVQGTNLSISYALFTGARNGVVVAKSRNIRLDHNRFVRLRNDGINASETTNLTITWNTFSDPLPISPTCDGVPTEVAARYCSGVWKDGDHAGGVQLRNAVINATLSFNLVTGAFTGGLSQNDREGYDAPLRNVVWESNRVLIGAFTPIQAQQNCIGCGIYRNYVRNGRPDRKATVRYGAAAHCGNDVEAGPLDPPCSTN